MYLEAPKCWGGWQDRTWQAARGLPVPAAFKSLGMIPMSSQHGFEGKDYNQQHLCLHPAVATPAPAEKTIPGAPKCWGGRQDRTRQAARGLPVPARRFSPGRKPA